MTLREVIDRLQRVALTIPDIRTCVVNDILKLNTMRDVQYGVFGVTQNTHTGRQGWMDYSLNLFYIDRLVNGQDNELQAQSHAIEVLQNLLRKVDGLVVGDVTYNTFTNRFQDLCAGAWAVVTLSTTDSECDEIV